MRKTLISVVLLSATFIHANIVNLKSLESNFEQSITNDQNSRIVYKGKMYAKRDGNQALWIYNSPVEKSIYYKGGHIVIIEPELEQAIFAKLSKVPNIMELLSSAKEISANTYETNFNKIKYTIKLDGSNIKDISYIDEMQNRVVIKFNSQSVNSEIADSKFSYIIPDGFDILEQ